MYAVFAVFFRIAPVVFMPPLVAGRRMPFYLGAGISMVLALFLAGTADISGLPQDAGTLQLLAVAASELLLGIIIAVLCTVAFSAWETAVRISGMVSGFRLNPFDETETPQGALFLLFAVCVFFVSGGHHLVLSAMAATFEYAPAGSMVTEGFLRKSFVLKGAHFVTTATAAGFILSFPVVAAAMASDMASSMLTVSLGHPGSFPSRLLKPVVVIMLLAVLVAVGFPSISGIMHTLAGLVHEAAGS